MDDIEVGEGLPALASETSADGLRYAGSRCLVRLHGRPIGMVDVEFADGGLSAAALADRIGAELSPRIAEHLGEDGIAFELLGAEGVPWPDSVGCAQELDRFVERAPSLSVVVCTRDRPESVKQTVRSILGCRYPADRLEVVVVDNAPEPERQIPPVEDEVSGEATIRTVRELEPGLSNARNKGLAESSGELIVFGDDDVEVDRDWLAVLAHAFERGDRVGASSGITLPGALETPTQRWIEGFGGRASAFEVRVLDLSDPPPDRPLFPYTLADLGAGRNMAFDRDLLTELGGFDPALGPGTPAHDGDDVEALLRVLLAGRQIVTDPAAIVWHAHPREYRELEDRVWGYGIGLTACLTKAVIDHPRLIGDIARKLPRGVAFALSPRSSKNAGRQSDFPSRLVRRELLGMAYGPLAYARSRRYVSRRRRVS